MIAGGPTAGAAAPRPLLAVDGDSFAHRAYHGVPKTVRRKGGKGGGAILGFANTLIRLWEVERPRAVLVGWDTLDAPTERHRLFPAYQGGRMFDAEIVEQISHMWASQPHWTAADLAKITTPTWIVDADHDEAIKRENTEFMAGAIPRAGLLLQPEVSHFSMLQAPQQFTDDVKRFLDRKWD